MGLTGWAYRALLDDARERVAPGRYILGMRRHVEESCKVLSPARHRRETHLDAEPMTRPRRTKEASTSRRVWVDAHELHRCDGWELGALVHLERARCITLRAPL